MKYKIGTRFKVKAPNADVGEEYVLCLVDYRYTCDNSSPHVHVEKPYVVLICFTEGKNFANRWSRSPWWCNWKNEHNVIVEIEDDSPIWGNNGTDCRHVNFEQLDNLDLYEAPEPEPEHRRMIR